MRGAGGKGVTNRLAIEQRAIKSSSRHLVGLAGQSRVLRKMAVRRRHPAPESGSHCYRHCLGRRGLQRRRLPWSQRQPCHMWSLRQWPGRRWVQRGSGYRRMEQHSMRPRTIHRTGGSVGARLELHNKKKKNTGVEAEKARHWLARSRTKTKN